MMTPLLPSTHPLWKNKYFIRAEIRFKIPRPEFGSEAYVNQYEQTEIPFGIHARQNIQKAKKEAFAWVEMVLEKLPHLRPFFYEASLWRCSLYKGVQISLRTATEDWDRK